jgi:hypothetical protein
MLNLSKDPHINLLYIFFFNSTLIYSTFNPHFFLTLIYIYLFINEWWVWWWMMRTEGEWSGAIAQKEDNMRQSLKHLKTQPL